MHYYENMRISMHFSFSCYGYSQLILIEGNFTIVKVNVKRNFTIVKEMLGLWINILNI